MSRLIMQQALDALKYHTEHTYPFHLTNVAIEALQKELAQPEQEPVAWMYINEDGECEQIEYGTDGCNDPDIQPLYTAPPRKEWVGLTDEERHAYTQSPFTEENYRAIEAKLKEKNT